MIIKNRTNVYDFHFHLVIVTKYRKTVFTGEERHDQIIAILKEIAKNKGLTIEHIEAMPDHVHMMLSFPPKLAPSSAVKSLKGASAREWFIKHPEDKKKLWGGHLWSPSFFMSTVGNVSKEIVAEYIKNQMTAAMKKSLAQKSKASRPAKKSNSSRH